jgi:hypothetical protein
MALLMENIGTTHKGRGESDIEAPVFAVSIILYRSEISDYTNVKEMHGGDIKILRSINHVQIKQKENVNRDVRKELIAYCLLALFIFLFLSDPLSSSISGEAQLLHFRNLKELKSSPTVQNNGSSYRSYQNTWRTRYSHIGI